jgi:hypothetical protein
MLDLNETIAPEDNIDATQDNLVHGVNTSSIELAGINDDSLSDEEIMQDIE